MADETKNASEEETDEYGLVIQKYVSTVLVVVPPGGYSEETLRHARSSLFNVHVGTWTVSSESEETIEGAKQDMFLVDGPLAEANLDDYSGVLFVAGGGDVLAQDSTCLDLAKRANDAGKLVGAWGSSVSVLARAGVLRGRKVTGLAAQKDELKRAGGKYTGVEVQVDGNLVTARDDAAGLRFGKALVQVVAIL